MDIYIVRDRIKAIQRCIGDSEGAHAMEGALYLHLLKAIADGTCIDPVACAAEALKTQDLGFSRWHA